MSQGQLIKIGCKMVIFIILISTLLTSCVAQPKDPVIVVGLYKLSHDLESDIYIFELEANGTLIVYYGDTLLPLSDDEPNNTLD